jgi:hypothetical protein
MGPLGYPPVVRMIPIRISLWDNPPTHRMTWTGMLASKSGIRGIFVGFTEC